MNHPLLPRLAIGALLLLLAAAWLPRLWGAPFHEDEAIYAAWSLQILRGDFWLSTTSIDKPPLTFYPIAASIALFGEHVWAARLPNLLWTALLLAALWRVASRWGGAAGLPAMLALASPLLWSLAASAFTDTAMVALAMWATAWAQEGKAGRSGAAMGLAFLAKPTALLLGPLVLWALWRRSNSDRRVNRESAYALPRFVQAGAAPVLLAWAWDASREAPSWWALGSQAYGTLGTASGEVGSWALILAQSLGLLGVAAGFMVWQSWSLTRDADRSGSGLDRLLVLYLVAWVPVHILLGFRPWERYLLPLVPLCALLVASSSRWIHRPVVRNRANGLLNREGAEEVEHGEMDPEASLRDIPPTVVGRAGRALRAGFGPTGLYFYAIVLALLAPALVQPLQVEPHDGRWIGIEEIGAAVEALPSAATVVYLDAGRPLAWYARDAAATMLWGGTTWHDLRAALVDAPGNQTYLVAREMDPMLSYLPGAEPVASDGEFRLFHIPTIASEP